MHVESCQWQIGLERILILPLARCGFDTPYLSLTPLGIAMMIPCTWGLSIYHVVCFFPVLLLSSGNVAIVRIHSTTPVGLLHGLILLPSGISGKMTITLDLITIIAMLVASFYRFAAPPIHLFLKPPKLP